MGVERVSVLRRKYLLLASSKGVGILEMAEQDFQVIQSMSFKGIVVVGWPQPVHHRRLLS